MSNSSDFARLMEEKTRLEMANVRLKAKLDEIQAIVDTYTEGDFCAGEIRKALQQEQPDD
jgi:hypothetical protein